MTISKVSSSDKEKLWLAKENSTRAFTEELGIKLVSSMVKLKSPTRMVMCYLMANSRITCAMALENILGQEIKARTRVHTRMVDVKPMEMMVS